MSLPTPNLDDLRFQRDLVDEARRRIVRYCPEWTEYNVSDPGVTLIELFAWMTEMLTYRLNRVPEKNYIQFLELLGVHLQPASSARAQLTFWLSAPLPLGPEDETVALIPSHTEVTTRPGENEEEIIFTTDAGLVITRPPLVQLRQSSDFSKNYLPRLGVDLFYPFNRQRPQRGDTFYLGFAESLDISGYILRLGFECEETQAVGVRREDPPLVWECSLGNGVWQEVAVSTRAGEKDTTGGLNNARGALVLYLPLEIRPDQVDGRQAYWLRCRVEQRRKEQGMYTESPRIKDISVYALGGSTWATHARIIRHESLGFSQGEPGQTCHLQHAPLLALGPDESVEVEEQREGEVVFVPWQCVEDFSASDRFDRHFTIDTATGELGFGPSVRQPDGAMRQYGRVPEAGRRIRMRQYRHGGGNAGNLPPGRLQVLRSAIPYVDRVSNLERAAGGCDQETLDEAKLRARRELRAQQRAVTAEDFENLARSAHRNVGRVRCYAPGSGGTTVTPGVIELVVVPAAYEAITNGDYRSLQVTDELRSALQRYLDRYRLLTTVVRIKDAGYLGVQACAQILVADSNRPSDVRGRVLDALRAFICPLALPGQEKARALIQEDRWEGWPFGRDLYVSEVYSLIQRVPGVRHVLDLQLSFRPLQLGDELPLWAAGAEEAGEPPSVRPLMPLEGRVLEVAPATLLCSLEHQIVVVQP